MFKNKKVIIFDMDGTLIDSVGIWNAIDGELIAQLGGIVPTEETIQANRDTLLRSFSDAQDAYLEYCAFLNAYCHTSFPKEEIRTMRYTIAHRYLKEVIDFKPNAEHLLHYLHEKDFTLVIASTTSQNNLTIYQTQNKTMMQKVDFEKIFSLILGRESVAQIKPHPEVHHLIMQTLNVTPQECLVIEDSLVGLEAAHRAGIETIVLYDTYSHNDAAELSQKALHTFEHYEAMLLHVKEELA